MTKFDCNEMLLILQSIVLQAVILEVPAEVKEIDLELVHLQLQVIKGTTLAIVDLYTHIIYIIRLQCIMSAKHIHCTTFWSFGWW